MNNDVKIYEVGLRDRTMLIRACEARVGIGGELRFWESGKKDELAKACIVPGQWNYYVVIPEPISSLFPEERLKSIL